MAGKSALEQWSYYRDRSVDLRPYGSALAAELGALRRAAQAVLDAGEWVSATEGESDEAMTAYSKAMAELQKAVS